MQPPHGFILSSFPCTYCGMKQANRNNPLREDVIDELLTTFLVDRAFFPPIDVLVELCVPLNVAANASSELGVEVEIGGVLTLEGDEVTVKGHVITDEHAIADGEL